MGHLLNYASFQSKSASFCLFTRERHSFWDEMCLFVRGKCLFVSINCLFVRHNYLFMRYKGVFVWKVKLRTNLSRNLIYTLPRHILSKNLQCEAQPQLVTAWSMWSYLNLYHLNHYISNDHNCCLSQATKRTWTQKHNSGLRARDPQMIYWLF